MTVDYGGPRKSEHRLLDYSWTRIGLFLACGEELNLNLRVRNHNGEVNAKNAGSEGHKNYLDISGALLNFVS